MIRSKPAPAAPSSRRFRLEAPVWEVGHSTALEARPERFVPAQVPGAVQLDWARAENWPPYWHGGNFAAYSWMEARYWTYLTYVPRRELALDERLVLVCGGVDYQCEVRLGGEVVHAQEGMFTPFEIDCTAAAATGAPIEVVVFPAPIRAGRPRDRSQASGCVKPAVSYGWDWHPRLIPLGIWEDTFFELRPAAHLCDVELRYRLDDTLTRADVTLHMSTSPAATGATSVHWLLRDPSGAVVLDGRVQMSTADVTVRTVLHQPALWWPHDHGPQPLYRLETELLDKNDSALDVTSQQVGFRSVRLIMAPGAWREPANFPKSRSHPPATIEINGRSTFARGTNWVNPEIFPGLCTAETYRPLLRLAREAHFNLLRCWGGAPAGKRAFFEQCDELGILVWQEFPLACNLYPDDEAYLTVLDRESRSLLTRLRRHPCLAIWCGGNELFNSWSGLTDQSLPLRLLNRNCFDLDPTTPFIATAPLDGMAHGDYRFRDERGREVFQIYAEAAATAYSEFGCPGPSPVAYLRTFIPPEELWPPRPGSAWESHHGLDAWLPGTWLCLDTLRHYFGEARTLDDLVSQGEWLQAAGYQCIFEEARRQKPRCAMALNWCFNEPWPSAANNSIVNWPAKPKPAYHAVAAACRPVMASARVPKFSWRTRETFTAELWLLNDRPEPVGAGSLKATLVIDGRRIPLLTWNFPSSAADRHLAGPEVRVTIPDLDSCTPDHFELELAVDGHPERTSRYRLQLCDAEASTDPVPGARFAARPLNT